LGRFFSTARIFLPFGSEPCVFLFMVLFLEIKFLTYEKKMSEKKQRHEFDDNE
jgi:hypothetical protein